MMRLFHYLLTTLLLLAVCVGCTPDVSPSSTNEENPFENLESFCFTSEELDVTRWASSYSQYMFPQADGSLQFGMGLDQLYCLGAYGFPSKLADKVITMDMSMILRPYLRILLRASTVAGPCYMLLFTDTGANITMQLSRYDDQGNETAVLAQPVNLLDKIDVWEYNRYQIGVFNEGDNVHFMIAVNGHLLIDCVDQNPGRRYQYPGNFFLQGYHSVVQLRGTDTDIPSSMTKPIKTGEVNGVGMYDVSAFDNVDTRLMSSITTARTFTASNGFTVNYRIYLPAGYSADKQYPLQMHLHGGGLRGENNLTQIMGDFTQLNMLVQHQKKEEFIFIIPECPSDRFWTDALSYNDQTGQYSFDLANTPEPVQIAALAELVDSLTQEFSVDENRLYLSGCSMGGMGSYDLLARYPDKFAAAIVGCALSDVTMAEPLAKTPMYICHGEADATIPVQGARDMVAALDALGTADYHYVEFEGRGHDFTTVEDLAAAMDWIYTKTR